MNPAKAKILICPHCQGEKEVLQLMSGNTCGAVLWSDNKQIAPMLPRVSFVQHCPKCGHYYLLSKVKKTKEGDNYSFETGDVTWREMKDALTESAEWDLNDSEIINLMLTAIWAYNDEFYRNEKASIPDSQDEGLKRQIIEKLLAFIPDKIMLAEFNREVGNFDEAISLIEQAKPSEKFLIEIASKISLRAKEKDIRPFILNS